MNIIIFSWRDIKHPLAGGAEQVMHEHAKGWVKAGHSVVHFSASFKGCKRQEEVDGVKLIRDGHRYLGAQWKGYLYYKRYKDEIDLVIDEFHGFPFFTPLYAKKPIIAIVQETARRVWFLNPLSWPMNLVIGLMGFLTEPLIFPLYKKVQFVTGSESAKKDVHEMGIALKDISVIPHGVIIIKPSPSPQKEKIPTIVYLGILSKDKGIEDALKCFSFLNNQDKFQFWVIGRPETERYLREILKLADELNLKDNIKFWGFVSQEEKFKLLAKSHVLINPSVHEGWGLINIEANSMGTPVVAYGSAGLVDSVKGGESGIICTQNTPEELAKNIQKILQDKKLYQKLYLGATNWSKNFTWTKSRALSLKLINSVVKG